MRKNILVSFVLTIILLSPTTLSFAFTDGQAAVLELGQPNDVDPFDSGIANNGGLSASTLSSPRVILHDSSGNLFVTDTFNNRVLRYDAPFPNGEAAVLELGQPNDGDPFDSDAVNNGGLSASTLHLPTGMALDSSGNLWVADTLNHRVLRYDAPFTNGEAAVLELGQPNDVNPFDSGIANNGGLSASTLNAPRSLTLDSSGNLWVVDGSNNRVLRYDAPFTNGEAAVLELGQPNDGDPFDSGIANNGILSASTLNIPVGVTLDSSGNLLVTDVFNHRVLRYDAPFTNGEAAVLELGQPNDGDPFDSGIANNGILSASTLNGPSGITLDSSGNLLVADQSNNRVLRYDAPFTNGEAAVLELGQPNDGDPFDSGIANNGGLSASTLNGPFGITLDSSGNLWIADQSNNRALRFSETIPELSCGPGTIQQGNQCVPSGSSLICGPNTFESGGQCLPVSSLAFCGEKTIQVGGFCVPDILAICAEGTIADENVFMCFAKTMNSIIGGTLIDIDSTSLLLSAIGTNPVITGLVAVTLAGIAGQAAWFIHKKKNSNNS